MLRLLPLLILLASCSQDTSPVAVDDDDDDLVGNDDDSAELPPVSSTTFAASLQGEAEASLDGLATESAVSGSFQFLYWESTADLAPLCRERYAISARGQRAPVGELIDGFEAWLEIDDVAIDEGDCGALPEALDLGFLLRGEGGDFRRLALVSAPALVEQGWVLGESGLAVDYVAQTYAALDLDLTWLALVAPGSWLDEEAALGSVSLPLGESAWLPMLLLYREHRDGPYRPDDLTGEFFLSTLWTVQLGADGGVQELPP